MWLGAQLLSMVRKTIFSGSPNRFPKARTLVLGTGGRSRQEPLTPASAAQVCQGSWLDRLGTPCENSHSVYFAGQAGKANRTGLGIIPPQDKSHLPIPSLTFRGVASGVGLNCNSQAGSPEAQCELPDALGNLPRHHLWAPGSSRGLPAPEGPQLRC